MKKRVKNGRDYGTLLMLSAMLVAIPRWAGAFIAADTLAMPPLIDWVLHYLNLAAGLGMGLVEVLGTAYLLDAWGKMKARRTYNAKRLDQRWLVLTGFVIGLFALMPLILAPYIVARMNGVALAETTPEWFQYIWSAAVVLSPVLIIGGVAAARDGLVGVSQTQEPKARSEPAQPKTKPGKGTAETGETKTKPIESAAETMELSGKALAVYNALAAKPSATNTEIGETIGVSRQYVGRVRKQLNGRIANTIG